LSTDGLYAHCTRPEFAAGRTLEANGTTYAHRLATANGTATHNGNGHHATSGHANGAKKPHTYADIQPIIRFYSGKYGKLTESHSYRDASGIELMRVLRFGDARGNKTYRPARKVVGGWQAGDPPGDLPLYGLPELAAHATSTVIVTEGERCADLVSGLGLLATTSSHGAKSARKTDWKPLAGRDVVVLPDADQDGERYASDVTAILLGLGCKVRIVRLPGLGQGEDVKEWLDRGGTEAELLQLIGSAPFEGQATASAATTTPPAGPTSKALAKVNEANNDPARLAKQYLRRHHKHRAGLTLRYWGGTWMIWARGAWRQLVVDDLKARIIRFVKARFDRLNLEAIAAWEKAGRANDKGEPLPMPVAMKVTGQLVANVVGCLSGYARLDPDVVQPSWLSGVGFGTGQAGEVLPTCNALVDLPALVSGAGSYSVEITPRFFNGYALDYGFNPAAPRPSRWLAFLDEVLPNDPQSIDLLQEWMGHLLVPDTSYQKILFIVGARRSGKGTICRLIAALIGAENVANPTLSSLAQNFGLEALIGKPAAIITDARLSRRTDSAAVVERLLSISGEDSITIDRKFNKALPSAKLPTRFILVSNELPQLNDASGALASRLLLLNLTESFLGREDRTLTQTLMADREGILHWAIAGWARLRQRGHFVQPKAGQEAIEQLEDLVSPVGAFLKETCEIDPVAEVSREDLFSAWKTWCQGRGRDHHGDEGRFGRDLRAAFPKLGVAHHRIGGAQKRFHKGLRLVNTPSGWGNTP
jgi:putative DNA primase/helicase